MPEIRIENTYPMTISNSDFVYRGAKAYVELCERDGCMKSHNPVHKDCLAISLWEGKSLVSFILYELDYEDECIHIIMAYTHPFYRRGGNYVRLFNELKTFRTDILNGFKIYSDVAVKNKDVMKGVLERTGRVKISEYWEC